MKHIFFIVFFISGLALGQGSVGYVFEDMPNDSSYRENIRFHSSFKPHIRLQSRLPEGKKIRIQALGDVLGEVQSNNIGTVLGYRANTGMELLSDLNNKWHFRIAGTFGINNRHTFPKLTPHTDYRPFYNLDIRSRISYTPNHIFNFQVGYDKNFIGEGSRSLLLSDYGNAYPFAKARLNFWRFEYSLLYQFMYENFGNSRGNKYMTSHYLSFNAAKWLNIGIFETVVFQPKDTTLNRGYDVEYLNPFVFYRPQEYSLGSSDNVLLGVDLNVKLKPVTIYAQLILDEFLLKEILKRTKWWANKYGVQLGVKGRFRTGAHSFFWRTEGNMVRPYTYGHLNELLVYGNRRSALAHPYGANFMEVLAEMKWQHKRWGAMLFYNYSVRGKNKAGWNYGGDIYEPYINRPYEYGHFIGQGGRINQSLLVLSGMYKITKHGNLHVFLENHFRYTANKNRLSYQLFFGVRSRLWNDYRNY